MIKKTTGDQGYLIFEWPLDSLDYIAEHWFMSPQITIEGYISQHSNILSKIGELYSQSDTEDRIRQLLRVIEVGFKVWPDNNGLFVTTAKLSVNAIMDRLQVSSLNQMFEEAAAKYNALS